MGPQHLVVVRAKVPPDVVVFGLTERTGRHTLSVYENTAHSKAPHMKVWREYSSQMKTAPTVIEIISDGKVEKF